MLSEQGSLCTGTLIAPQYVLTAAHCVFGDGRTAEFRLGPDLNAGSDAHEVVEVFVPDGSWTGRCAKGGDLDVALLKLAEPVSGIRPAQMGRGSPSAGATVKTVGYGAHTERGEVSAGRRFAAEERVLRASDASFRTEAKTGSTDEGDSGGPAFLGSVLQGVTSCGNGTDDNWYTGIDAVLPWIQTVLEGQGTGSNPPVSARETQQMRCSRFARIAVMQEPSGMDGTSAFFERCVQETQACTPGQSAWVSCIEGRALANTSTAPCDTIQGCE